MAPYLIKVLKMLLSLLWQIEGRIEITFLVIRGKYRLSAIMGEPMADKVITEEDFISELESGMTIGVGG